MKNFNFFEKRTDIFSYSRKTKELFFNKKMIDLIRFHYQNCKNYKKILKKLNYKIQNKNISNVPFLPVSLFKKFDFYSVKFEKIKKF